MKLKTGSEEKGAEKVTSFRTKKILSAGNLQAAGRDVMSERPAIFGRASFPGPDCVINVPVLRHRALVTFWGKGRMRRIAREHPLIFRRPLSTRHYEALNQRNATVRSHNQLI